MYIIENDMLRVQINPMGAELSSLFNKTNGLEYIWSGDALYWGKKSPVLFPIVGTLKNNQYFFNGKSYPMNRHGFAREKMFTVVSHSANSIHFELQSDEHSLQVYPFQFNFSLIYTLSSTSLSVCYQVKNKGNEGMYFSVGGHPAFRLPLTDKLVYDDYYLSFNKNEMAGRWPISPDGLIESTSVPLLENCNDLKLSKSLFYKDAIVLKHLESDEVQIKSDLHQGGVSFSFEGFPYLGIWAAKDANFICIEPWCGIADSVESIQVLTQKEGIEYLNAGEVFERTWRVTTL
jgi:galactose mutarotase-like enzyme